MAFDPSRNYMLMFGGWQCQPGLISAGPCSDLYDTWTWNGTNWSELRPAHRPDHASGTMVYDEAIGRLVYMTQSGSGWEWSGSDWESAWPPGSGAPEAGHGWALDTTTLSVGYDDDRHLLVVLSVHHVTDANNADNITSTMTFVTSGWDGLGWKQLAMTSGKDPVGRPVGEGDALGPDSQYGRLPYDRARHRLLAMGIHETWTWDGTRWASHAPGITAFAPSSSVSEALYDPVRNRVLWFEGSFDGKHSHGTRLVYAWTGDAWIQVSNRDAPFVDDPAIAFDDGHDVVVLFGGRADS